MSQKLTWSGKIGIENADKLKKEVEAVLLEVDSISLDLSQSESIDTAGVQLLVIIVKEAITKGISFSFDGQIPEKVAKKIAMGGFTNQVITEGPQLANALAKLVKEAV